MNRFQVGDVVRIAKSANNDNEKELDDKDLYWRDNKIKGVVIENNRPDGYPIEVRFDERSDDYDCNIFTEESLRLVRRR